MSKPTVKLTGGLIQPVAPEPADSPGRLGPTPMVGLSVKLDAERYAWLTAHAFQTGQTKQAIIVAALDALRERS